MPEVFLQRRISKTPHREPFESKHTPRYIRRRRSPLQNGSTNGYQRHVLRKLQDDRARGEEGLVKF